METTERLWSVTDAATAVGVTRCAIQKRIDLFHVQPAVLGHTQNGGYKYRESDLRMMYGDRFHAERVKKHEVITRCLSCGHKSKVENYPATHGLCLECWSRELNKYLIEQRMKLEEATEMALKSLRQKGIIKE